MATDTLPRADYTDTFGTSAETFHPAEAWARAAFEPASPGDGAQLMWRRILQLRLGDLDDDRRVAGWEVLENGAERLVLAAESWHLAARLVFTAETTGARVTTRVTFRRLPGRLLWSALGPVHRRAVPGILDTARRRLAG
jgi:hypothetical protein